METSAIEMEEHHDQAENGKDLGQASDAAVHNGKMEPAEENPDSSDITESTRPIFIMDEPIEEPSATCCGCGEENKERGNWTCQCEMILTSIGWAAGLGQLWRFPMLCFRHGGGFLAVWLGMHFTLGFPLVLLEMTLGQFTSQGPPRAWRGVPLLHGVGFAVVVMMSILAIYQNTSMAYILHYLFVGSLRDLPNIMRCDNYWNTVECNDYGLTNTTRCREVAGFMWYDDSTGYWQNYTQCPTKSAPEEYWRNYLLQISDGLENMGAVQPGLAGFLFLSWLMVFLVLAFGIKSAGKVAYLTTTIPFVLLVFLLFRAMSLDGAVDGLIYHVTPYPYAGFDRTDLWVDAMMQVIYSLGVGCGCYTTLSSYNRFHNNTVRDAVLVVFANILVGMLCLCMSAGFLGFLGKQLNEPIENLVSSGPHLVFVVFPRVLGMLPASYLWSILFYLTLLLLAFSCQFVIVETIVTSLLDLFPSGNNGTGGLCNRRMLLHLLLTFTSCILFFLLGLPLVAQGGMYLYNLLDNFVASGFVILPILLLKSIGISWFYAINRWGRDLSHMLQYSCCYCCNKLVTVVCQVCWCLPIPLMLVGSLLWTSLLWPNEVYFENYKYSEGHVIMGWLIVGVELAPIPIVAIINCCLACCVKGRTIIRPPADWGPYLQQHHRGKRRGKVLSQPHIPPKPTIMVVDSTVTSL
ncbi:sodium- and chloride-dependent glycine transporter 1-like [Branchiostoma lanceolatum]|uniref:sodium- and chloride-dependent glycine transporter 1-like n=1 Tax=Branchiostoma lanceolatum TaxID=7740 RepID=UPI003453461F